ncbi:MAG: ATP-dependent helicase [Pseudomonadota bacterium]
MAQKEEAGELIIIGPPGCGKSTRLATKEIPDAAMKFGPDKIVVTSYTKAGAREIATKRSVLTGEKIPVNSAHVGTLHALCYRTIGTPDLAETHLDDWTMDNPAYPMMDGAKGDLDEGGHESGGSMGEGDQFLQQMNICRARLIPPDQWPDAVKRFAKLWDGWKAATGYFDFTDLIQYGIDNLPYAPGQPDVIFVDEAQDFTAQQLKLIRLWGEQARWIVLVGDDDQTIYDFTGASPEAFIRPGDTTRRKRVLSQSYRVPRAVQERALRIIRKVSRREEKEYRPRNADGIVRTHMDGNFKDPSSVIDEAIVKVKEGKRVMFLTTCAYMLDPLKEGLRKKGLPFCNPYRKRRGDWNPLLPGDESRTTARDILSSFLATGDDGPYWSVEQLMKWLPFVKVGDDGLVRKNGKAGIKALKTAVDDQVEGLHTCREVLSQLLGPGAVEHALSRDVDWLYEQLVAAKQRSLQYPTYVFRQFGEKAIMEDPKIIIGTIHSVKGGEADCVYLFPDISKAVFTELQVADPTRTRDALYRLFYVGMTRAKEELVLMNYAKQGKKALYVEL